MDENLDQIGERLRKARESRQLLIEDVAFQTKLPSSAISALESDDFSHFTSPVYAKSFLQQYSSFLNVDAESWLDALQPSSYIEGGPLFPILDSRVPHLMTAPVATQDSMRPWMSALVMLAFTVFFVYSAIIIYQYFETHIGKDESTVPSADQTLDYEPLLEKTAVAQPLKAILMPPPSHSPETPESSNPGTGHPHPPRAIIVR